MADKTDFYTRIKRSMFQRINDVGAKPFLLFQYYLTYATAPKINPSLKTVALDMGMIDKKGNPQISAVSHLKRELINAGWIAEKDDEILITFDPEKTERVEKISSRKLRKSQTDLRNSQRPIEKISNLVEKISTNTLDFLKSPYIRNENKQENYQKEQREEEESTPDGAPPPHTNERVNEKAHVEPPRPDRRNSKQAKPPAPTFESIVADLSAEPAYLGIDVPREAYKAVTWLKGKPNRKFTRAFFLNWLNRIDRPVVVPESAELTTGDKQNGQFKSAYEKRDEAARNDYIFTQEIRRRVEARRAGQFV